MQVTIYQAEIEEAIRAHIHNIISVRDGHEIKIDLKATRGDTGFQAIIDIEPVAGVTNGATKPAPSRPAQRVASAVVAQVQAQKPVITTGDLKRMHEEEAAQEAAQEAAAEEAAAESGSTQTEEAPGEAAEGPAEGPVEETQAEEAPAPAPAPVAKPAAQAQRPATQVAGAAPGAAGAPPRRLFAGFARPNNAG